MNINHLEVADKLNAECVRTGAVLNTFERGPMGMTLDSVKATKEWQDASNAYRRAFSMLRMYNAKYIKEIRVARKAKRETVTL